MPQPMKIWRANARQKLIAALGGKCTGPGCQVSDPELLTFAHNTPLSEVEHNRRVKMGANARMVLYRKEFRENKLHLACQSCNNKEQARCRPEVETDENGNPVWD